MTKQFTLLQLASIIDGRMFTKIDDVYEMLNHITGQSLMTHHLPTAMDYLKKVSPIWFKVAKNHLKDIEDMCLIKERNHEQFCWLHGYLSAMSDSEYNVPQLTEDEMKGFGGYMVNNSLLNKVGGDSSAE